MKELEWGETPWDNLSREELLREVQRMASALITAQSTIKMMRVGNETSTYWTQGVGGSALHKIDQALHLANEYESENLYRSFYRYAVDLLFDCSVNRYIGFGWAVCPVCGTMFGETPDGVSSVGTPCATHLNKECPGILRPIEWGDLQPQEAKDEPLPEM